MTHPDYLLGYLTVQKKDVFVINEYVENKLPVSARQRGKFYGL